MISFKLKLPFDDEEEMAIEILPGFWLVLFFYSAISFLMGFYGEPLNFIYQVFLSIPFVILQFWNIWVDGQNFWKVMISVFLKKGCR